MSFAFNHFINSKDKNSCILIYFKNDDLTEDINFEDISNYRWNVMFKLELPYTECEEYC